MPKTETTFSLRNNFSKVHKPAVKKWRNTHLSSKDPAHADDTKDVEDCWADDGSHAHVTVGYEDTCEARGGN